MNSNQKYCKYCGEIVDSDSFICPKCGRQLELSCNNATPIIINNVASSSSSSTTVTPAYNGKAKNKWISLLLCLFTICGHKFYEGKFGMGVLYLLTCGLFLIGWLIDMIVLIGKPNPYYV
jgi:RNA polymerase subunit RPABC4/transcription elongation factor Spt4